LNDGLRPVVASKLLSSVASTDCFPAAEKFASVRLVQIVYEHQDVICAVQEPVFLLFWKRTPTIPQAQRAFEHLETMAKRLPGGIVFVVLTAEDTSQPDRMTADFFARHTRSIERQILAHAFILEGTGLKNSAIRAAIRAMQTMSRVIFPWTIAASVDEGFMFLAKKTGFITEPEARAIIADVAKIRAARAAAT
jgi:hypothetical protein